jgi:hypothetical protein
MTRKTDEEPRCSNGIRCVAYPTLGEPSKLSRGNPGTTCFACEEQHAVSELKTARANNKKAAERRDANKRPWAESNQSKEHLKKNAEVEHAREVLERRRRSVLTCERGLRSALASGDERLVRRWSRSLREAEERVVWAEADVARTEKRVWPEHAS